MDQKIDNVNHPPHYTWLKDKCGIEVIDITRHMDFDLEMLLNIYFDRDLNQKKVCRIRRKL